eukprot:g2635.t1
MMMHVAMAHMPVSRGSWLAQHCAVALTLPAAIPGGPGAAAVNSNVGGGAGPAEAHTAFADALLALPGDGLAELDVSSAVDLVRAHGQPLLEAVRHSGRFLYRGETLSKRGGAEGGGSRAVIETPDLLDEETYGSAAAAEYFRAVDVAIDKEFGAFARPSNAHIMVSSKEAAAAWGTACSVWPLGDSLDYTWLENCSEWWDPGWERRGRTSSANGDREAFFWRDEENLRKFLSHGLRVNSGLPEAMRRGHELLVRGGEFSLCNSNMSRGKEIIIRDAFVCIPASKDEARCSFCVATKQPICHYRPRRPWRSQSSGHDDATAQALPPQFWGGRVFRRKDGETAPVLAKGLGRHAPAGSEAGGKQPACVSVPPKSIPRGQFSASPATGLIGLQENEFLGDFFGCLGFLSLVSESTVRGAIVDVMLAGASRQHQHHPGPSLPARSSAGLVEDDAGAVGKNTDDVGDGAWSNALAFGSGSGVLPRGPATCALWCAIALGALVRGTPLDHARRYVELAQDSLLACYIHATLGTARAYTAMAVLFNFLGEKAKSHQYVKFANGVVDALPPVDIPRVRRSTIMRAKLQQRQPLLLVSGLRLLSVAAVGAVAGHHQALPAAAGLSGFPVEQGGVEAPRVLPAAQGAVGAPPVAEDAEAPRALLAVPMEARGPVTGAAVPVEGEDMGSFPRVVQGKVELPRDGGFRELLNYAGFAWAIETELASVEETTDYWENAAPIWELSDNVMERDICGLVLSIDVRIHQPLVDETCIGRVFIAKHSSKVTPVATHTPADNSGLLQGTDADRVCLDNVKACAEVQKTALSEMLRLEESIDRNLGYLQLLNREVELEELMMCFGRCLDVMLRYPGLCRYNIWLHHAHCKLYTLVFAQKPQVYETMRASYNSARPVGSRPAPPFEGWRGIADVCDHACCRRATARVLSLLRDYFRARSRRPEPGRVEERLERKTNPLRTTSKGGLMPKKDARPLKKTCDFCVQRKRSCDGFAVRRCSFCIATKQPECHYRPRRSRRSRPFGNGDDDDDYAQGLPPPPSGGRSFWPVDGETGSPALTSAGGHSTSTGLHYGRERLLLPLKRGQFSASPATGLIGLQENEFLGDFFGCLGFLSLASESTVRRAMVSVMLADLSLQHQHHPGAPLPSHSSPALVGEDAGSIRQIVGDSSDEMSDNAWSNALRLTAENRSGALPRDPSTCVLWCAIALGALVRGIPLDHVSRYVELARDALGACYDGATLGTARAYIAMTFLHNFVGDQVRSHEYMKRTNIIVERLPPDQIPMGLRDVLQYAGFAKAIEKKLVPVKDIRGYWEDVPPIWQLSESVTERDICSLVISVQLQINRPLSDETGANRVVSASQVTPVAPRPPIENTNLRNAELDAICLANFKACEDVQKNFMLPELLRLEEVIERSKMHLGIGGMLYYGSLSYLQFLNRAPEARASYERCLQVFLRYPGLCRYSGWLHFAHAVLHSSATLRSRQDYEALRATYNSARLVGSRPAPPFEEWRGISDVCGYPGCRRFTMQMKPLLLDYCRDAAATHDAADELP